MINEGVTAIARSDGGADTLRAAHPRTDPIGLGANTGGWVGARNAGAYTLSLSKPGYMARDNVPIVVKMGRCSSPAVTMLELFLEPLRQSAGTAQYTSRPSR